MENNSDKELTITIQTPQGNLEETFPKTTKVQEVIDAVVKHFGFAQNGKYDLRLSTDPDNPLKPQRTLVSYGIKDGDILIFTDMGVAV